MEMIKLTLQVKAGEHPVETKEVLDVLEFDEYYSIKTEDTKDVEHVYKEGLGIPLCNSFNDVKKLEYCIYCFSNDENQSKIKLRKSVVKKFKKLKEDCLLMNLSLTELTKRVKYCNSLN